jgi:hypothetical protein
MAERTGQRRIRLSFFMKQRRRARLTFQTPIHILGIISTEKDFEQQLNNWPVHEPADTKPRTKSDAWMNMLLYNTSLFLLFADVINRNQKISCLIMFKDIITACSENDVRLRNTLKAKTVPQHATKDRKYSSYSFSTSALDGGEWSASRAGERTHPLYRRVGGLQCRSGHRGYRKNPLPLPGIEPRKPGRPARCQTLY